MVSSYITYKKQQNLLVLLHQEAFDALHKSLLKLYSYSQEEEKPFSPPLSPLLSPFLKPSHGGLSLQESYKTALNPTSKNHQEEPPKLFDAPFIPFILSLKFKETH